MLAKVGGSLLLITAVVVGFWPHIKNWLQSRKPALSEDVLIQEEQVPDEVAWCYFLAERAKDAGNGTAVALAQKLLIEFTNMPETVEQVPGNIDDIEVE